MRRHHALYVAFMATSSALGLAKGLVYAKVLDPTAFGYYGLVAIVLQFGLFLSNWGLLNALNNHLPIAFGRGHSDSVDLLDRSLAALILTSLTTAVVYLALVTALSPADRNVQIALSLAALVTLVSTVTEFHVLVLRVRQRILAMAGMYLLRAVLAITLGATAGVLWGYQGVIAAELVALLVVLFTARTAWLDYIGLARPDPVVIKRLLRAGAPLMLSNVIIALSLTTDRIFVASALPEDFGQYAFASLVVVGWVAVNGMLEQAVAPRLLTDYGGGTRLPQIRRQALRIAGLLAAAGLAGLGLLLLVKGPLSDGFLSEYSTGLDAMPVLWLGGVLMLLAFPGFILHAIKPSYSLIAAGLAATVAICGGIALTLGDPSVQDFAWLFVAAQATALVAITVAVSVETRRDRLSPDLFRPEGGSEG